MVNRQTYLADHLAGYVNGLQFEHLPPEVIEKTKLVVLDTIGVSIYGSSMPWAQAVYEFAKHQGGEPQATIVRYGNRTSATHAALVNGTFGHSNDFDDQYALGPLHSSAGVWTAIPLAEMLKQGGKEVITSVVIGYDVTTRIAEAGFTASRSNTKTNVMDNRGFQDQAICGVLGSAAQAAKQLGLDAEKTASALGVAGSYPGGLREFFKHGSDTKRFHFGKSSQQGIEAAMLAERGFKGPPSVLEGHDGFFHGYYGDCDISKVTEELGSRFDIMWSCIKQYPVPGPNHAPIDALRSLMKKHDITAGEVKNVEVRVREQQVLVSLNYHGDTSEKYHPSNSFSASFSVPYALAIAMQYGSVLLEHFFESDKWRDPSLPELARKVTGGATQEFDHLSQRDAYMPCRVTITLKNGQVVSEAVLHPEGDPRNPMSREKILAKFFSCTTRLLAQPKAEAIVNIVDRLEEVPDIRELTSLLH